jgi:tetratricopeptide (TPR) repeat protein
MVSPSITVARPTNVGSAYALRSLGQVDKALADLNPAIEASPSYAYALAVRGIALSDKGDLEKARADFDKAISIDPNITWYYTYRGLVNLKRKCRFRCASKF